MWQRGSLPALKNRSNIVKKLRFVAPAFRRASARPRPLPPEDGRYKLSPNFFVVPQASTALRCLPIPGDLRDPQNFHLCCTARARWLHFVRDALCSRAPRATIAHIGGRCAAEGARAGSPRDDELARTQRHRARLRARSRVAAAAAAPLGDRRCRRNRRRQARPHLGVPPSAFGHFHGQRNAGRGRQGRQGQSDQRARISAAVWAIERLLHAGAVGAGVRQSRKTAAGLGRSGRSGLPGNEVPPAGRLLLARARARHLRRSERFRLSSPATARRAISTVSIRGRRILATTRKS